MVHRQTAAVGGGRPQVDLRRHRHQELGSREKELEVPLVEIVLPERGRTAVLAHSDGVHEAHPLQGQTPVAAFPAVDAPAATTVVSAGYEVELRTTPDTIGPLTVGCPRWFVQLKRTEFFIIDGHNTKTTFRLDELLLGGCHHE